ncbi:UNVERIFIED_CONTAM: hypothetical protein FKN15_043887 [Acipenser sinensis]
MELSQEEEDGSWELFLKGLAAELCPGCGAYGHAVAICPTQYEEEELPLQELEEEEPVCPVSGGEEPVCPVSGGEEPVRPVSGGEEPVRPVSGGEELKAQTPIFFWEGRGRKWSYEVLISSQGLMQIGWCTLNCRFNQEEGVGDTADSYAYDGNRVRKWNVTTTNYGKSWAAGDIVTCLIDLDEGTISFCLNGQSLGIAFNSIKIGPGLAYFPAISLSFKESVAFNFGSRPLRYPFSSLLSPGPCIAWGYQPLQDPPSADLLKAQRLLGYIKNVFTTKIDTQEGKLVEKDSAAWELQGEPTVLVTLAHIFNHFAPLMCKVYLVEGVLMRFLLSILEGGGSVDEHPLIQQLLDLMWLLMEDYEVNECLKQLMMSLLRAYRFSPIIPDLGFQGREEREAREESPEERLRRRAYERGCQRLKKRIEVVEELQVQILKLLLNNKDKGTNFALHPVLIFAAASISQKLYKPSLFQGEASRYIFLNKFRKFLQENASNRGNPTVLCPPEYMVCFLHRLIAAVRFYWEESKRKSSGVLGSEEAYVPPQLFYNGKVDYFDLQRLGGLLSHLKKTLKDDLASKANIIIDPSEIQAMSMDDLDEDEENGTVQRPAGATAMGGALARPSWLSSPTLGRTNRFLSTAAVSLMSPRRPLGTPERMKVRTLSVEQRTEEDIEGSHGNDGLLQGRPPEESDQPIAEKSLLEIVDGIVMMYNLSVHQQLGKKHMADLLSRDKEMAASFLNSVLNQLNWAFSEFIGMIQEIQQAAERPERNFVDTRQLKVCATCFDLSVSLLRVLEMTVTLVPEIFLDWTRPSAELLLRRLAQLLNQVLNRVTAERNLFDRVVNLRLPGLESVDHYPILVAVTGILVRILVDCEMQG